MKCEKVFDAGFDTIPGFDNDGGRFLTIRFKTKMATDFGRY